MSRRPYADAGDGRNVDERVGILAGEAAEQQVPAQRPSGGGAPAFEVFDRSPLETAGQTYYERPVVKEPVWIWAVPAYFYVGGAAGAAAVLGSAAQIFGRGRLRGLTRRCRWLALAGAASGTGLLIYDLGRPRRFLNMLRVFRPTSAMNMGSWVLASSTSLAGASVALSRSRGLWGGVGNAAGLAGGVLGLPLSGYTAVLLADTAVPLWQGARRSLPALFVASGMGSATALLAMTEATDEERRVLDRLAIVAQLGELVAAAAVERDAGRVERVGRPLKEGLAASLWTAARALTAGSLVLSIVPGSGRRKRAVAGLLGTAGAVAIKFAVFHAGKASARDPRATFDQQRAGYGSEEVTGARATTSS